MTQFGDVLRADRERAQLSQIQLAQQLGVSQQAIANWENGTSMPRRERRRRLLEILGPNAELVRNPPKEEFIDAPARVAKASPPHQWAPDPGGEPQQLQERAAEHRFSHEERIEEADNKLKDLRHLQTHLLAEREATTRALPAELRPYIGGSVAIGAQNKKLYYLSPKLGVEVRTLAPQHLGGTPGAAVSGLLLLAVARSISGNDIRPPRDYHLILVVDNPAVARGANVKDVMFDGQVLGIDVHLVNTPSEAAELIVALERDDYDGATHY